VCRAQNTIKCKDFAPEGQTRMGVIALRGFSDPARARRCEAWEDHEKEAQLNSQCVKETPDHNNSLAAREREARPRPSASKGSMLCCLLDAMALAIIRCRDLTSKVGFVHVLQRITRTPVNRAVRTRSARASPLQLHSTVVTSVSHP
jgi:hypothetical protein